MGHQDDRIVDIADAIDRIEVAVNWLLARHASTLVGRTVHLPRNRLTGVVTAAAGTVLEVRWDAGWSGGCEVVDVEVVDP